MFSETGCLLIQFYQNTTTLIKKAYIIFIFQLGVSALDAFDTCACVSVFDSLLLSFLLFVLECVFATRILLLQIRYRSPPFVLYFEFDIDIPISTIDFEPFLRSSLGSRFAMRVYQSVTHRTARVRRAIRLFRSPIDSPVNGKNEPSASPGRRDVFQPHATTSFFSIPYSLFINKLIIIIIDSLKKRKRGRPKQISPYYISPLRLPERRRCLE